MLDLRAFPFTDEAKDKIRTKANNHYRISGIVVTGIPKLDNNGALFLDVQVSQQQMINQKLLSTQELVSRCESIFEGHLPYGYTVQISVLSDENENTSSKGNT